MTAGREHEVGAELVGLDNRPRPASARARFLRGIKQSAPFSSLQRRIIFFNLLGLALLVTGVLYLNEFRASLIEQRVDALRTHGRLIALTIAETAYAGAEADPEPQGLDAVRANLVLSRLIATTNVTAQLYDTRLRLIGDTETLGPRDPAVAAQQAERPTKTAVTEAIDVLVGWIEETFGSHRELPFPSSGVEAGINRDLDVRQAARGQISQSVRVNARNELIVSIALPIERRDKRLGVLVLSTPGGEIDEIVSDERALILQVFLVAAMVSIGLSILLANTIAAPIRKLAAAAESEGTNAQRPLNADKIEIPDMTARTDEIGELSAALIRMTEALYRRVEAIESFASDVAHEIKNPLTSLRSAVETMTLAKTPEQRERLLKVIQLDVTRMDRLVTDISNASRLDAELVRERMAPFDLAKLIEMLASVTEAQADRRKVRVKAVLPAGGLMIRGLEGRIAQVITNLLDNALSFSPEGGTITVGAEQREHAVRVTVTDDGPGIPPDNIDSIFQRFYTERPGAENFGSHSGLGLSISRQIVEAHGGKIWAENRRAPGDGPDTPPRGARFTFDLPA